MGLFSISSTKGRWNLNLPTYHKWLVLCPVCSIPFDILRASAHFLHIGPKSMWGNSRWIFLGLGFPGTPTGRGLFQRIPPTVGISRWFNIPETWTPRCTSVWIIPKLWQSYSGHIHMPYSQVSATLLWGGWIPFSGWPPSPHPVSQQKRQGGGEMATFLEAGLQVHLFLRCCCLLNTLVSCLC